MSSKRRIITFTEVLVLANVYETNIPIISILDGLTTLVALNHIIMIEQKSTKFIQL